MLGYKQVSTEYLDAAVGRLPALSRRRKGFIAAAFTLLTIILLAHSNRHLVSTPGGYSSPSIVSGGKARQGTHILPSANLHLLIPADHKDVNLCKTMLSAGVAGFPTPTLINWGATFDDKDLVAGGSHLAKISGVLEYLSTLGPERDDDIVLLVDGYDIWFQLRPSTLIARFHAINSAANARIEKEMGTKAFRRNRIEQNIVFSAQKRCWPWKPEDPPCYAVPQSSLPEHVYGPKTDTDIGFDKNPYVKFRQRYLNSGDAMGRVGAMKALFSRAMAKAEKDKNFGSDQKIFSEIFGDQEFQREVMQLQSRSYVQRFSDFVSGRMSFVDGDGKRNLREWKQGREDEFGIGLDYASLLGHPTVFAEEDAAWITHTDALAIARASSDANVVDPDIRVSTLVTDITSSQPPFRPAVAPPSSLSSSSLNTNSNTTTPLPSDKNWPNIPLYTNLWTAVVPGLIHHNAHRDGLKSLRRTWWDRTWFFPYARALYAANAAGPTGPVAVVMDEDTGLEQGWWSPIADKGGAQAGNGSWLGWKEVCGVFEGEVFGEG